MHSMHPHWHERMSLGLHPHETKEHRRERILRERQESEVLLREYMLHWRAHADDLLRSIRSGESLDHYSSRNGNEFDRKDSEPNSHIVFRLTTSKLAKGDPAAKGGINGYSSGQE